MQLPFEISVNYNGICNQSSTVIAELHNVVESVIHDIATSRTPNTCRIKEISLLNCTELQERKVDLESQSPMSTSSIRALHDGAYGREKREIRRQNLENDQSQLLTMLSLEAESLIDDDIYFSLNEQRMLEDFVDDVFQFLVQKITNGILMVELYNQPTTVEILTVSDDIKIKFLELRCEEGEIEVQSDISVICSMFCIQYVFRLLAVRSFIGFVNLIII